jgi:hypothetical protein
MHTYHVYSHADADGGIAAAIFMNWFRDHTKWGKEFEVKVTPVNHGTPNQSWSLQPISGPCAILDFNLHPQFLTEKFFVHWEKEANWNWSQLGKSKTETEFPPCYWLDHHPTGATFPFLNVSNIHEMLPHVNVVWDVSAISTPGLMRTHSERIGIPSFLIDHFQELIDFAEVIDGALYTTSESAFDFSSPTVQLRSLFSSQHPGVNSTVIYKKMVETLSKNPNLHDLLESDPIYSALISYEHREHLKSLGAYSHVCKLKGLVAFTDFRKTSFTDATLNRFLPYHLHPQAQYAVHILPSVDGYCMVSAGINPWNKPRDASKHLGHFFADHLSGGGHSFSAGGRVRETDEETLIQLIDFLNHP